MLSSGYEIEKSGVGELFLVRWMGRSDVARSGNWLGVEVYKFRGLTRLRKESTGVLC